MQKTKGNSKHTNFTNILFAKLPVKFLISVSTINHATAFSFLFLKADLAILINLN